MRSQFALGITLVFVALCGHADLAEMRGSLFRAADDARTVALSRSANVLAPITYAEAMDALNKAQSLFDRSGSVETIRRTLTQAENRFNKATEAADIAATALDAVIQARRDASSSEAKRFADDEWEEGEVAFLEATRRLERGSISSSQRYAKKAEAAYREAELIAIKANYLDETRDLIERAEKLRAERYAPVSLSRARERLQQAEDGLNKDRYNTDRPRSLALDAKHAALHAIFVSTLDQRIRDRETNLEAVLLEWEETISKLGDALDKPLYFDFGEKAAINEVLAAITDLQNENAQLTQNVAERTAQVARMQELLGGGNQTIDELERLLAQQARHKERFERLETMFPSDQAIVLRQGDNVIIRMIGLNFDSGAAQLKAEHMPLLSTLQGAISVFPDSQVTVEGHTDAFGSDALNHTLSQSRAQAVVHHLLSSMPLSPTQLTSVGYGESRPVANNETAAGRKRNRRIDVVIRPSWLTSNQVAQGR